MVSETFTHSNIIDMSKEKDWTANLGMLDWDSTSIVFTKRSLIEFLKYTGTTVDTHFGNIQKLPRYAKFGKLTTGVTSTDNSAAAEAGANPVRSVAGGGLHTDIFDHQDEGDALSMAPPKPGSESTPVASVLETPVEEEGEESGINFSSSVKPSRRVRTVPGGPSSLSNFWDASEEEQFKPSRRVRQGPGGRDSVAEMF